MLGPRGVPSCCSLPSRQTDLCSNLCSSPIIAIATDPSDPVNGGLQARTPHGQGLRVLQAFKRPFFMLVLHFLVQRSCGIFVTTWCCRKARSQRQWHHGVSSLRSTRQRFSCRIVQKNYAEWIQNRLVEEFLHAYVFFFTLPEPHLFCLALAGGTSGRSCGNNEIIRGAMKLSAGGVRFMPRATAEHMRAFTIGLLHATSVSNMYRKVPMQTARNHTAVHVADEKGALPVVTLILFWRKMHISPLTMGRRCICSLQDEHCAAPALSGLEWETFACFHHVLCTEGLAYLKTAAINYDLKEPANKNACVFGVVGQRSVGKTEGATALFYRKDSREVAAFSYVEKCAECR